MVILRESLFAANQAESLLSSLFKILFKVTGSFSEINKLVSSANKMDSRREASQRSLTYMIKSRGPRIEPCGTPQRITSGSDPWPLYSTNRLVSNCAATKEQSRGSGE